MTYKTTPLSVSVHLPSDSAVFGESAIIVSVDDEGAGAFVVLQSNDEQATAGKIAVDLEQLETVIIAARALIGEHNGE